MSTRDSKEIVAAAISYKGEIYTLPKPARHHDIIRHICEKTGEESIGENIQGFLDDKGRFASRTAAMFIVKINNQPMREGVIVLRELYSENLW